MLNNIRTSHLAFGILGGFLRFLIRLLRPSSRRSQSEMCKCRGVVIRIHSGTM